MDCRNWSICFLCQVDGDTNISIPSKSVTMTDAKLRECCTGQVNNLKVMDSFGELPDHIDVSDVLQLPTDKCVDEMMNHKIDLRWHKTCRLLVNDAAVQRVEKNKRKEESSFSPVKKRLRRSVSSESNFKTNLRSLDNTHSTSTTEYTPTCFICDQNTNARLSRAATLELSKRVEYCAKLTNNDRLIRKLTDGDLIAIDAEYHLVCLSKLYREASAYERGTNGKSKEENVKKELVFRELLNYLEEFRGSSTRIPMRIISKLMSRLCYLQA